MSHTKRLAVLIAACALPIVGSMAPASAADNANREVLSFEPEIVATCEGGAEVGLGFDLVRNIHTFTDKTGAVIRQSRNVNFTGIFQLMGTDQTVTFQGTRQVTIDFVAGTFNSVGNYRNVTMPGQGNVFHKAGRELFDENDNLIFSSGPKYSEESPDAQADVCSLFDLLDARARVESATYVVRRRLERTRLAGLADHCSMNFPGQLFDGSRELGVDV